MPTRPLPATAGVFRAPVEGRDVTRFLLATDSVHTTAAACDYLLGRLSSEDAVLAVAVVEDGADPRDAGDALNVASARLAGAASVATERAEGDPAEAIVELADDRDVDELVVGARSGAPGSAAGVGSTARAVLAAAERPVVVIPLPPLEAD